jgi:hypothetical protein
LTAEERARAEEQIRAVFARRPLVAEQPPPPTGHHVEWVRDTAPMLWVNRQLGRYEFDRAINVLRTMLYDVAEAYQIHEEPAARAGDYLVLRVDRDLSDLNLENFLREAERALHAGVTVTVWPPESFQFEDGASDVGG